VKRTAIVGPTATGKTALAIAVARRLAAAGVTAEIVSADSMCVYRGMDIGTAKPSAGELEDIPHHLVSVVEPTVEYSVADYQRAALAAVAAIEARGSVALLVGGTGLYVDAVIDELTMPGQFPDVKAELESEPSLEILYARLVELDPLASTRMEPTNRRRIIRALEVCLGSGQPFSAFGPGLRESQVANRWALFGLRWPRRELGPRVAARYEIQMKAGFLAEAAALLEVHGETLSRTALQALGYRELWSHLRSPETYSLEAAVSDAVLRTRQFSVRQERWFRRDERIGWFDREQAVEDDDALAEKIAAVSLGDAVKIVHG
jgi:tRNA dimethylallyltransferase